MTYTPRHNNALIRTGEARLAGWSRSMLYLGFNILPRSVFWSADLNGRSDNTDVIRLKMQFSLRQLFLLMLLAGAACVAGGFLYSIVSYAGDDAHFFGVGERHGVRSFSFATNAEQFRLIPSELKLLEAEWKLGCFETFTELHREIDRSESEIEFYCLLTDGYKIDSECKYAEIDGEHYLQLELVTEDGGGFQADFNYLRLKLDNILTPDRIAQLQRFASFD